MITIFTIPKSFQGPIAIIQRNAIRSWLQTQPACEIILLGDDPGVAETAKEFNLLHIPEIKKNEFGTPLLSSGFEIAQREAKNDLLMYINADIVIMLDLMPIIMQMRKEKFLISGRRWDLDVTEEIIFERDDWKDKLLEKVKNQGQLHGFSGMDYFIFKRKSIDMPEFAVGRPGWDSWLFYHMRNRKIPVIDATLAIAVIHQNHDFSHSKFGEKKRVAGPEWHRNITIAGGLTCMSTLREADWLLTDNVLTRPNFFRRIYSMLLFFYPVRVLMAIKRKIQNKYI